MSEINGASFTGLTVARKVLLEMFVPPLAVPPSSRTVTVIAAVPVAFESGTILKTPVVLPVT